MKTWQRLLKRWEALVFRDLEITPRIRALRLVEEALEYGQAADLTEQDIETLKRQVYDRPKDEPEKEIGGVLVCALLSCNIYGLDAEDVITTEFERIMDPVKMDSIRRRNLNGDKIGFKRVPRDSII